MNIRYILLIILCGIAAVITVVCYNFTPCINNKKMNSKSIVYIENAGVRVGVLPHLGGTIVFLSKDNSPNMIKSDSALWNTVLDISEHTDFFPIQGHTVWVGPQSQWWMQQSVHSSRKAEQALWPPDPYITLGAYTVLTQNEWSVSLTSQHSDVWGVTMEKEIAVNPDGSVFVQVTLINSSQDIVSWDIWHNTRMHGYSKAYVQARKEHVRVVPVRNDTCTDMPYGFVNDYFTYKPQQPDSTTSRASKVFIYPELPVMYAFTPTHMLSISFEKHVKNQIHPEQGLVELYTSTEESQEHALLELEYHSAYSHIGPGDSIQAWEVWNIEEYAGEQTEQAHVSFIQSL